MEWIRISSNKLKIMLSAEDAQHYALDCATADYADVVTRAAFREILTDVKEETGFDANEDKIYIQMYPSREGGCELFVTRIGLLTTDEDDHIQEKARRGLKDLSEHRRPHRHTLAVRTETFSHLLSLCRRLEHRCTKSELWLESGVWWLLLTHKKGVPGTESDLRFINEYGEVRDAHNMRILLSERGVCICAEGAVEQMANL